MTTALATQHFSLLPGESVLLEGGPVDAARTSWMLGTVIGSVVSVVGIPFLPFALLAQNAAFGWHRWWLTDRRIVVQTGIIGYQVRSIPLNRVTDVSVSCSWWDRMFGLTHITVRDMTGEVANQGVSTGVGLYGVADASTVRDAILNEVHRVNQPQVSEDDKLGRVVELLEVMAKRAA